MEEALNENAVELILQKIPRIVIEEKNHRLIQPFSP